MPAKSLAQFGFMAMCRTPEGRSRAKGKCPPLSVAKEYVEASKGKTGSLPEKVKKKNFSYK